MVDGHLEVTGYDKVGFKGIAKIVSSISYKGSYYEVLEIGSDSFRDCSILTSITISNKVRTINFRAFDNCINLTTIVLPNSMITIGYGAFDSCKKLKDIIIPNSVQIIDDYAFHESGLTSITIPNSIKSIIPTAFLGCPITSIIVNKENQYFDSRDNCNAIIETSSNCLIVGCENTIIPESVTSIGNHAFGGCTGLPSINISNNITSIGYATFSGCTGLSSINIPSSVSNLGLAAFHGCLGLKYIHCQVKDPNIVYYPDWGVTDVFSNETYKNAQLFVPKGTIDAYKSTKPWKQFVNIKEE